MAQETGQDQSGGIEEVIVTGFRQSLNVALDEKRGATNAVDVIVAEDIADFPDLNLAESIQRIPGVSIARDAGEGRQISVRGLDAQFTRVRINGMEALTTAGGTDAAAAAGNAGGTNRARGFDFNVFASELFNQIRVTKTTSAEVEEGSLGATVDLQVARPFDYNKFTFVTGVQGSYNDLSDDFSPRAAMLFANVFAEGKFGVLFSAAYTDRELLDEGASTVRWQTGGGNFQGLAPDYASAPTLAQINGAFRPRIPRYDIYEHEQERLGLTASIQFQPTESTRFTFDALYSDFDATRSEIFLEAPVFSGGGINQVDVRAAEVVVDGTDALGNTTSTLVYGVFDDVDIRSEARFDELSTEFTQFTLEGTHAFSDTLRLRAMAGYAKSEHDNPIQTTLLWDAQDIDGYSFDFRANNRLPVISYGSTDVTDPNTWTLSQIRLRPQTVDNKFNNYEASLAWDTTDSVTLRAGVQFKSYDFATTSLQRSNGTTSNIEGNLTGVPAIPTSSYARIVRLGEDLDIPAGTTRTWVVPDLNAAAGLFNLYDTSVFPLGPEPALANNFFIEEDDEGAFVQADFRFEALGMPIRGNIGVRYVETTQKSTGFSFTGTSPVPISFERTYSDTLPSLNLVAEVTEDFLIRVGVAKVMARPGLANLNPGASANVAGNNRTVNLGDPFLDPFRAKTYDLGFEWYFAPESLLGLALFYKDIGTFVQTVRETRPFTGNPFGLPDSVAIAACGNTAGCSPDVDWNFNLPANTPGGDLKGFEISYQQPFTFLPAPFDDFGVILNYTHVDSEVQYVNALREPVMRESLSGLSRNAANATIYFDNGTLSARVAAAYRDEYLTTIPGRNANDVEGTEATLSIDFSAGWQFNDNIEFTLEALNLTDEFQDQWVSSVGNRLSYYHHQGRQYLLGARFRY